MKIQMSKLYDLSNKNTTRKKPTKQKTSIDYQDSGKKEEYTNNY
jgi:hypothetical protein